MATHIRVKISGRMFSYRVPPEKREELQQRIDGFKAQQAAERRDFITDL
jgi:hypothetical protein